MSEALRNRYFDQEATTWSRRYRFNRHFQSRVAIALRLMPPKPQRLDLVDYGCGSGVLMRKLLELGHCVTGIDASSRMIEEAQRNVSEDGKFVGRFNLVQAEEFKLPQANQTWDGIFCLGVLEYVDDPFALLKEFSDALRLGGFLVISYPNKKSLLRFAERAVYRNARIFRPLGILPHLTAKNSYMRYQKHQFAHENLDDAMLGFGLSAREHVFHVAPSWLRAFASSPAIGMTAISSYRKAG